MDGSLVLENLFLVYDDDYEQPDDDVSNADFLSLDVDGKEGDGEPEGEKLEEMLGAIAGRKRTFPQKKYRIKENQSGDYVWKSKYSLKT